MKEEAAMWNFPEEELRRAIEAYAQRKAQDDADYPEASAKVTAKELLDFFRSVEARQFRLN